MIRHASDYDDFFVASKEQAEEQVAAANKIVKSIKTYCDTR